MQIVTVVRKLQLFKSQYVILVFFLQNRAGVEEVKKSHILFNTEENPDHAEDRQDRQQQ